MNWLTYPRQSSVKGMSEAMKRPKYRLPISSFAIAGYMHWNRGHFTATIKKHMPNTRAMLVMLEPRMLPMETPIFSSLAPKSTTLSSGRDVAKPTKMKPTVVFPKPVMLETFTELFIVTSLAITTTIIETRRIRELPINPSPSNAIRFTIHV